MTSSRFATSRTRRGDLLVDTSVWVDFLRGADTTARDRLRERLTEQPGDVVTSEPIAMELLAGPTSERVIRQLTRLVDGLPSLSVDPLIDFRTAASVFRACRRTGKTVRNLSDCLIAAVAIRADVTLVHKDADFDVIAAVTTLRAESWR